MRRQKLSIAIVVSMTAAFITFATMAQAAGNADEEFLRSFAQASAAEVEAGKLAAEKARNAEVKAFGEHMADFHSRALARIAEVAALSNVDVEAEPSVQDKGQEILLEHRGSGTFDLTYIDAQVERQNEVAKMLQSEIDEGLNPSAKQFATEALPVVRSDLEKARDLQDKVTDAASSDSYTTTR